MTASPSAPSGGAGGSAELIAGAVVGGGVGLAFIVAFMRRRRQWTSSPPGKEVDLGFMGPSRGKVTSIGRGYKPTGSKGEGISLEEERIGEQLLGPSASYIEAITTEKKPGRQVEFGEYVPKRKRKQAEKEALGPSPEYLERAQQDRVRSMFRPSSGFLGKFERKSKGSKKKKDKGYVLDEDLEV